MMSIVLFSPSKVNLFFRVLSKRPDGYHDIASLYQAISLGDTLTATLAEEDQITCDDPSIPCDERNLIYKAVKAFRERTGFSAKVHWHLNKKVPMEAGLGGGSSNAASALFALNALSSYGINDTTLCHWASTFSSDAPFFFSTGTAYCAGRGEILTSLLPLEPISFWIAKPEMGLSTPQVYKMCNPSACPPRNPQEYLHKALQGQLELFNDLEHSAFLLMPSLQELKQSLLERGFSQVSMTGSGTAFICMGGDMPVPTMPGIRFFPVRFIQRTEGKWYNS